MGDIVEGPRMRAARLEAKRAMRKLKVRQSLGTVLVLTGMANVDAFFWLTFGYPAGILGLGASLILVGVGRERDTKERGYGVDKGTDSRK